LTALFDFIKWIGYSIKASNMKKLPRNLILEAGKDRRQFLKLAGYGALGLMAGGLRPLLGQSTAGQHGEALSKTGFVPDLDISLVSKPGELAMFPGAATQIWQYQAEVIKGDKSRVVDLPRSYLGPIIKARQGEKIRIRFTNSIPEKSIVHWHGLHVPEAMDGHPRYVIPQGHSYLYEFEVKNRAGTYWYHPHPHGRTGPQVYGGLAGLFLVSDSEEQSLGLPDGEYDVPLVIQDRAFDRDNQLLYTSGNRMAQMTGFLGDSILINGRPDFTLPVSTTAYRLRLLNGSNSRIYKLAWQDARPLTIIGTDGGLLGKPVSRPYVFLAPGERIELWSDFTEDSVGYETALMSLSFDGGRMGRGMMMGRGRGNNQNFPNGAKVSLFKFKVTKSVAIRKSLPQKLSEVGAIKENEADNYGRPRQFFLEMGHMQWTINGRVFQMEGVADEEMVRLGTKEIWEFINNGGGMMAMPHPIHLHGKQFRVIERQGVRHQGYVDEGWKDTVLLMPGERIRILVDFDDSPGLFLYHCHNLEHEDMGMMRNYYVRGAYL
jgi:FtsP/CotA-like multicopper oxidase with cupredoxin domain